MIFFSAKYPTNKYSYCIFNIKKVEKLSENEVELVHAYFAIIYYPMYIYDTLRKEN